MKSNLAKLMIGIAALTMTACSNNELYDPTFVEQSAKGTYTENFLKKYPHVDLNQSWDYSTKQTIFSLPSQMAGTQALTRGGEYTYETGSWYEVDPNTFDWLHTNLVEGVDHRDLGKPFYLEAPGNEFTIVPIYQGVAGAMWNLHVVIDDVDIKLWNKINAASLGETVDETNRKVTTSSNGTIQIKDEENDEWHNLQGQWYDWGYGNWNSLYNTEQGGDHWQADGSSNKVTAVRSLPYTFRNIREGAKISFYLEVTVSGNYDGKLINEVGAQQSSIKGMMLSLNQNVPRPLNIPADNEAMIIGCEDADLKDSDWDMNDLVLLVYGPKVPETHEITEGEEVETRTTVRYMVEDLGAKDDFDFNDIVIDMSIVTMKAPVYEDGKLKEWKDKGTRQEAIVRHLGGTLPFILTVGDATLPVTGGQSTFKTSPNLTYNVTGWNPDSHNISVQVEQEGSKGVYNNIVFPKAGVAPMIIAVNGSEAWMPERQSVPESWFYVPE